MIGIHESPTEDDDERAIDHFNKTIIKLDGRYQNLVRRLNSSSHLHDYDNTIKDQLLKGVIEEVPPNDEVVVVFFLNRGV
uniref:Helitron helicase n=1 Tax=Loa loa TaxID=7209 RepID=A0A1I7W4Z9_LOALO